MLKRGIDAIIVDDQLEVCEVVSDYLEEMSLFRKIVHAEDGITASFKLKNQDFSVIILDINLPKKSGIDIITQNADNPKIIESIILISGAMEKDHLDKAVKAGVRNILIKPFAKEQLQIIAKQVAHNYKTRYFKNK